MGARQKAWARRERARLIIVLGAKCVDCGATDRLTFDCKIAMGPDHHKLDTSARISFYRSMLAVDNLALRCHSCNSRKGNGPTITTDHHKKRLAALLIDRAWPVPREL